MNTLIRRVRMVDGQIDTFGSLWIEDQRIGAIFSSKDPEPALRKEGKRPALIIEGPELTDSGVPPLLLPAFIDLHAHFRDPGYPEKETLESGCLAAVAGGYGTVVCMANTRPVIDTVEIARTLSRRAQALGLIDLYPVLSLTEGMAGKSTATLEALKARPWSQDLPLLLSEDGRDVEDREVFQRALILARDLGIPVSCHCDWQGEDRATQRALDLGRETGAALHIAHVSTIGALEAIRRAKAQRVGDGGGQGTVPLTCEVTPHHLALTARDAEKLGAQTKGKVHPPLRQEADRQAILEALEDGTVDAIATDHAPHTEADKENGAPGFTGLETAFAVCFTALVVERNMDLKKFAALLSSQPARILALKDRGRLEPGLRGDLVLIDPNKRWTVRPELFRSRGKNSPFADRQLTGKVLMTIHGGRLVYEGL